MSPSESPPFSPDGKRPEVGSLVYDEAARKVGRVMDLSPSRVNLRPEGGGREWEAPWPVLRPPTDGEVLSSRLSDSNRRGELGRALAHPEIRALGSARDPGA